MTLGSYPCSYLAHYLDWCGLRRGSIQPHVWRDLHTALACAKSGTFGMQFVHDRVPGWKAVFLRWQGIQCDFLGTRSDGLLFSGQLTDDFRIATTDSLEFAMTFAQAVTAWVDRQRSGAERQDLDEVLTPGSFLEVNPATRATWGIPEQDTRDMVNVVLKVLQGHRVIDEMQCFHLHPMLRAFFSCGQERTAVTHVFQMLHPRTRYLMRHTSCWSLGFINWLQGAPAQNKSGDFTADRRLARQRRDILSGYPGFTHEIAKSANTYFGTTSMEDEIFLPDDGFAAPDEVCTGLLREIDAGRDFVRRAARHYAVSSAVIRRMYGVDIRSLGPSNSVKFPAFLNGLNEIDENHIPTSRNDIRAFNRCQEAAQCLAQYSDKSCRALLRNINGRFAAVAQTITEQDISSLGDFENYLCRKLLVPGIAQHAFQETGDRTGAAKVALSYVEQPTSTQFWWLKRDLLRGHSLSSAFQASKIWHRDLYRLDQTMSDPTLMAAQWTALIGNLRLSNGLDLIELCSAAALMEDGNEQRHCAGTLVRKVISGQSVICSFQSAGTRSSTIEFRGRQGWQGHEKVWQWSIRQHAASGNAPPRLDDRHAADEVLARLRALPRERIDAYIAALKQLRDIENLPKARDRLADYVEYDPFDLRSFNAAWENLSPFLARPVRHADRKTWIDHHLGAKDWAKAL